MGLNAGEGWYEDGGGSGGGYCIPLGGVFALVLMIDLRSCGFKIGCYSGCQLVAVGPAGASAAGAGTGCEAVAETRVVTVVVMRSGRRDVGGGVGGVEMGLGVAWSWVCLDADEGGVVVLA